jgi:hypothetical protein
MPASADDHFTYVGRSTATTLSAPGYTTGGTSINVASTTNWPTLSGVIFAIDEIDANGERIAGSFNSYEGVVTSATQISSVDHLSGDGDRDYSAGATTRVYILVDKDRENRMVDGLLVEHKQDGKHSAVTADSIVVTGNVTAANFVQSGGADSAGWTVGLPAVSSVTALGNRSYTVDFADTVSNVISEGMRIRTTRTVASTQNAFSLDGSNDYYNKTSPAGMTFTDDFSVSAWVYLTAYQAGNIASRYNGTSGWAFQVKADGTVQMIGFNAGAANYSFVKSYQSIPLNKWVHISAQLDMSTFTATTTTSYVMIDGVNVPATVTRGGSNPTALIQAGNLEIGTLNTAEPFAGYIDQVAIYSAKVTQATHLAAMHQGLTGSETSLISAYVNGSVTDLNTTNANNLTAQNGATGIASSPFGNRATSSTLDYALVMKVDDDEITVQVPEGCTIPTSGGVSAVAYSTQANPYGFVSDKGRWELQALKRTDNAVSSNATYGAYMSGGYQLVVPSAGGWEVGHQHGTIYNTSTTTVGFNISASALTGLTLAQGNAISPFTIRCKSSAAAEYNMAASITKKLTQSASSTYVMYTVGATTSASIDGATALSEITATPSSL